MMTSMMIHLRRGFRVSGAAAGGGGHLGEPGGGKQGLGRGAARPGYFALQSRQQHTLSKGKYLSKGKSVSKGKSLSKVLSQIAPGAMEEVLQPYRTAVKAFEKVEKSLRGFQCVKEWGRVACDAPF